MGENADRSYVIFGTRDVLNNPSLKRSTTTAKREARRYELQRIVDENMKRKCPMKPIKETE